MNFMQAIEKTFPVDDIYCLKLENAGNKIVITIGKQGGITLDSCRKISKKFRDSIPENLDLTVQSPGIGFEIKPKTHVFSLIFLFHNEPVKIFYKHDGKNLEATGYLQIKDDGTIALEKNNFSIYYPIDDIIKVKTILKSEV